jgi:hypothetical protein
MDRQTVHDATNAILIEYGDYPEDTDVVKDIFKDVIQRAMEQAIVTATVHNVHPTDDRNFSIVIKGWKALEKDGFLKNYTKKEKMVDYLNKLHVVYSEENLNVYGELYKLIESIPDDI